jgi:hypothetical protein
MELSDEEFAKSHDFIKEVSKDPTWLLTCLTCIDKNLNPNAELTYAIWIYAGSLGCHSRTSQPPQCTALMINWLEEMKEAEAPVLFTDIPDSCFFPRTRPNIMEEWRRYFMWLQTGEYTIDYSLFAGCDMPALYNQWLKARGRQVNHATA